ncbi:hypothetical protein D8674_022414 [Pyrus ussuriensis x Pyrus communis]|uniref:Uncharacterized protein n=1 Tax=Pyrus ussuriensis x Pyrus communis TaxID=2448454 RepID=A0A5N5GJT5_9ROSA|nr:hypothetical protein D8674_022414 [Pyrus ussuriensis x Pyrus communis]
MAAWTVASRRAANMARVSSPKSASTAQPTSLVHRRGFATGGDRHGPGKVNFWEDPTHPSKWKEEQKMYTKSKIPCFVNKKVAPPG